MKTQSKQQKGRGTKWRAIVAVTRRAMDDEKYYRVGMEVFNFNSRFQNSPSCVVREILVAYYHRAFFALHAEPDTAAHTDFVAVSVAVDLVGYSSDAYSLNSEDNYSF